ncbi:MAG: SPASM domain-containing protein [Calditrichaeota bacterium]|nr:SPASM domain-containing protein [Calditrichota bacterium]
MIEANPFLYLKYITFHKFWNALKVFSSFHLSRFLNRPIVWGKPYMLNFEPTNLCNLQCVECPTGMDILKRPKGSTSLEKFKQFIDPLKNELIYLVLYFQGEPFINRNLLDLVRYAADCGIFVQISTNGHFFNTDEACQAILDSGVGAMILSMDGTTEETYLKYRVNGKFDRVKSNFERLARMRNQQKKTLPRLYLQFLVTKHNEHQIEDVKTYGKEIGVDKVLLKSLQVYNFDEIESILPENKTYRRYMKNADQRWELAGTIRSGCYKLWSDSLFTWDGKVAPCCFDKDVDFQMGDLNLESFDTVWENDNYSGFRERVLKNRKQVAMCTNCTEGLKIYRK